MPPGDTSIRLITWNLYFIPNGEDLADTIWRDQAGRTRFIADLRLGRFEEHETNVMVFSEGFDVDAQAILSMKLCAKNPSFVRPLRTSSRFGGGMRPEAPEKTPASR